VATVQQSSTSVELGAGAALSAGYLRFCSHEYSAVGVPVRVPDTETVAILRLYCARQEVQKRGEVRSIFKVIILK
jgi:hypothetical protein